MHLSVPQQYGENYLESSKPMISPSSQVNQYQGNQYFFRTTSERRKSSSCWPTNVKLYIERTVYSSCNNADSTSYEEIELKCQSALILDRYNSLLKKLPGELADRFELDCSQHDHHPLSHLSDEINSSGSASPDLDLDECEEVKSFSCSRLSISDLNHDSIENLSPSKQAEIKELEISEQFLVKKRPENRELPVTLSNLKCNKSENNNNTLVMKKRVREHEEKGKVAFERKEAVYRRSGNLVCPKSERLQMIKSRFSLDNWRILSTRTFSTTAADSPPTIMISYCHAEARDEARSLKRALEAMNLSVYLDLDEIYAGYDWQDSLNSAVLECEVLIAMVSRSYGATQWTKREFKLADLLGKHIIPVRLDKRWPPAQLALQLSTLQYIEWDQAKSVAALVCQSIETRPRVGNALLASNYVSCTSELMLVAAGGSESNTGSSIDVESCTTHSEWSLTATTSATSNCDKQQQEFYPASTCEQVVGETESWKDELEESFEEVFNCSSESCSRKSSRNSLEASFVQLHSTESLEQTQVPENIPEEQQQQQVQVEVNEASLRSWTRAQKTAKASGAQKPCTIQCILDWRPVGYVFRRFAKERRGKKKKSKKNAYLNRLETSSS